MTFNDYDVVRLKQDIPQVRVTAGAGDARLPVAGDVGTILMVHSVSLGTEPSYIVECVDPSGGTSWMADVFQSELELVESAGASAA